jgi:glycosyltransferase involved in cell wall biosynthesis
LYVELNDLHQALIAYQQAIFLSDEWAGETSDLSSFSDGSIPCICVVTPVFNSVSFIDETISSILSQSGRFIIRLHIQDGESTDGTLEKIEKWHQLIQSKTYPILCEGIEFSYASEKDRGMYDAINRGVAAIALKDNDYMTWINADDRLMPGAFAAISNIFKSFEQVNWIGGRVALIDDQGILYYLGEIQPYSRLAIQSGLHDGRKLPFIMQEGTFWRGWLWNQVGGVNDQLRLAGDYDLWRRFAEHTGLMMIDSILATHRKREGQLSGVISRYYTEVDAAIAQQTETTYEQTWEKFRQPADEMLRHEFSGRTLQYNRHLRSWHYSKIPHTSHLNPSIIVSESGVQVAVKAIWGEGFGEEESANPIKRLPAGIRWTQARSNVFSLDVQTPGTYRITLTCQTFHEIFVRLSQRGKQIFTQNLPVTNHDCNCQVVFHSDLESGVNHLELGVGFKGSHRIARIIVIACEAIFISNSNCR